MIALTIRQPYAEEILREMKEIAYRTMRAPENRINTRVYIYAPIGQPPDNELAEELAQYSQLCPTVDLLLAANLPTGVLVGTVIITECLPLGGDRIHNDLYAWKLCSAQRLSPPLKPTGHPQPTWFYPF